MPRADPGARRRTEKITQRRRGRGGFAERNKKEKGEEQEQQQRRQQKKDARAPAPVLQDCANQHSPRVRTTRGAPSSLFGAVNCSSGSLPSVIAVQKEECEGSPGHPPNFRSPFRASC